MRVLEIRVTGLPNVVPINPFTEVPLKTLYPSGQWERYDADNSKGGGAGSYDNWLLTAEMEIEVDYKLDDKKSTIKVKMLPGWYTDFGTVPLLARSFVNHVDPLKQVPFLVHDVLCNLNFRDRKFVDRLLYEMLRLTGDNLVQRSLVYYPTRVARWFKSDPNKDPWITYEKQWSYAKENPQA